MNEEVYSFSYSKIERSERMERPIERASRKYKETLRQATMTQLFEPRNASRYPPRRGITDEKRRKVTPAKSKLIRECDTKGEQETEDTSAGDSVETAEIVLKKDDKEAELHFDIATFNFNDYDAGSQYDVVINEEGDSVSIQAPMLEYYNPPKKGFMCHHVYFGCEFPLEDGSTIIPATGMYEFYFMKSYIKHEHEKLNGKINAWRIESLYKSV